MAQSDKAGDHVRRYKESNGADGHMWDQLGAAGTYPCLLLTTVGRKSQEPRTTPLVYGRDGDKYLVIGSKGGRPTHPAWYLNLVANQEARDALDSRYAMGRVGQPMEIANAILIMTSKQSSFMTGSPMIVDGGQ